MSTHQTDMTLDEALKIMWLRTNYKPLGELLTKGEIDRSQLEWAVQNAYNAQLKQASSMILKAMDNGLTFTSNEAHDSTPSLQTLVPKMPVEEARKAMWLFNPHKGKPIGHLLDTGQIALKDLAFAVENAWNPHLKDASLTLMLMRLDRIAHEAPPQASFAHLVSSGRSYALRRQFQAYLLFGALMGALMGGGILIFIQTLLRPRPENNSLQDAPLLAIVLVFVFVVILLPGAFFMLLRFVEKRFESYIQRYRQGEEGEKIAVDIVRHALDGHWYIFQNVELPAFKADLDMVLVGPTGIWVLEVKNLSHPHRNEGDKWHYNTGQGWRRSRANPSAQARKNAGRLSEFLKADGIQQWITPAIVWVNSKAPVITQNPSVAVWSIDSLRDELGNLRDGNTMPDAKRDQIIDKLRRLCQPEER